MAEQVYLMAGPLSGLRVFDLTLMMVGPWSTQNLGQMGAEVFHVERGGTDERSLGGRTPPSINGTSVVYMTCNMNKRSVFLDLKSEYDLGVAKRLISSSDVFVENMRPGVVDRLGLSYEDLRQINPRLIYVAVSGWGETGPMASKPATDNRIQAYSGFSSINGAPGTNNEMYRHYTQLDGTSGNYITQAVLLALMARERTGRGQRVDISMLEVGLALQTSRIGEYLATGKQPENLGSASSAYAPNEAYLCEEGVYLGIEARTEKHWQGLCQALGLEGLITDPRFSTSALRLQNREALKALIESMLMTRPARWWQLKLNKAGVPNGKFTRFDELVNHPQPRQNGYIRELDTKGWGRIYTGGMAWRFSRTPAELEPAHLVGEDTADILDEADRIPDPEPILNRAAGNAVDSEPPLSQYRVVELAQGIAGPYAGVELADAGADVIKVEHMSGDIARYWEPRGAAGLGAAFIQLNRGKRSVRLDLESEAGRDALRELIRTSDVLIEDVDLTRDLSLDVAAMVEGNDRLIHNRISGWGPIGPWAHLPGSEIGAQLASEVTTSLGHFGRPPVRVGTDLASTYAGIYSVEGILAALYRRQRDGLGQQVDVSLYGCLVVLRSIMWAALSNPDDWSGFHLDSYRKPPESGLTTKDGIVALTLGRLSDEAWTALLDELGFERERDAEKISLLKSVGNPDTSPRGWESKPVWEQAFARFTTSEVIEIMERHGGGGYPVNNYPRVFEDPQVKHLDVLRTVSMSSGESMQILRSPCRLNETPARIETGPPLLGEHTEQVLQSLKGPADLVVG
jgi:crotonobetainyl-CoA:carnitine CoA-transferase CaiB-like acyl-CoA transferase